MKAAVVYDSWYEDTEKIAQEIAQTIGKEAVLINAKSEPAFDMTALDLLIVGSPTHGGTTTPVIQDFLNSLGPNSLQGVAVAAFDTRVSMPLLKLIGFASGRLGGALKNKGGLLLGTQGFYVEGKKGPLKPGELPKAREWTNELLKNINGSSLLKTQA